MRSPKKPLRKYHDRLPHVGNVEALELDASLEHAAEPLREPGGHFADTTNPVKKKLTHVAVSICGTIMFRFFLACQSSWSGRKHLLRGVELLRLLVEHARGSWGGGVGSGTAVGLHTGSFGPTRRARSGRGVERATSAASAPAIRSRSPRSRGCAARAWTACIKALLRTRIRRRLAACASRAPPCPSHGVASQRPAVVTQDAHQKHGDGDGDQHPVADRTIEMNICLPHRGRAQPMPRLRGSRCRGETGTSSSQKRWTTRCARARGRRTSLLQQR